MKQDKAFTESVDKDTVKQWYICQIEDRRDVLQHAETNAGELDLEEVNRQLQILDEEKKRRGYR